MNFQLEEILTVIDRVKEADLALFEYQDADARIKIQGKQETGGIPAEEWTQGSRNGRISEEEWTQGSRNGRISEEELPQGSSFLNSFSKYLGTSFGPTRVARGWRIAVCSLPTTSTSNGSRRVLSVAPDAMSNRLADSLNPTV